MINVYTSSTRRSTSHARRSCTYGLEGKRKVTASFCIKKSIQSYNSNSDECIDSRLFMHSVCRFPLLTSGSHLLILIQLHQSPHGTIWYHHTPSRAPYPLSHLSQLTSLTPQKTSSFIRVQQEMLHTVNNSNRVII